MELKKYKVKFERIQRGKKLDWEHETVIESYVRPRIGEGRQLLVDPPIHELIVSVEELK
jgi:hypothetical protein